MAIAYLVLSPSGAVRADGAEKNEIRLPRSFQLLLGTAQGKGIQFGQLGYGLWPPPLVNYYRGFNVLCRKAALLQTLREAAEKPGGEEALSMLPETFLFYPARADDAELNEHQKLATAHAAREADAADKNIWIVKPSDGAKGERIEVMQSLEEINAHLAAAAADVDSKSGWVVQRYLDNPLLLRGNRKFDLRCWVLLDPDYKVHLYKEAVLRTGAVAYDLSDLSDKFVHLTNHCIAETHPDFGERLPPAAAAARPPPPAPLPRKQPLRSCQTLRSSAAPGRWPGGPTSVL